MAHPSELYEFTFTQGADPASVTLLVLAGTAGISIGKTVLLDIWMKILLPRLERTFGRGVFLERKRKR